jgi:hypothetical protein
MNEKGISKKKKRIILSRGLPYVCTFKFSFSPHDYTYQSFYLFIFVYMFFFFLLVVVAFPSILYLEYICLFFFCRIFIFLVFFFAIFFFCNFLFFFFSFFSIFFFSFGVVGIYHEIGILSFNRFLRTYRHDFYIPSTLGASLEVTLHKVIVQLRSFHQLVLY